MSNSFTEFHKIWIEQCAATEGIASTKPHLLSICIKSWNWNWSCSIQAGACFGTTQASLQRLGAGTEVSERLGQCYSLGKTPVFRAQGGRLLRLY